MNTDQRAIAEAARHVEKALNELNKAFDVEGLCQDTRERLTTKVLELKKVLDEITVNMEDE